MSSFSDGRETVYWVELNKQHEAAFYRNTIVHFFVARAITELACLQAANDDAEDIPVAVWTNAKRLRELLMFEFFFPSTGDFAAQIEREVGLIDPDWQTGTFTGEDVIEGFSRLDLVVAHRVVGSILEAYSVLADELALKTDLPADTDEPGGAVPRRRPPALAAGGTADRRVDFQGLLPKRCCNSPKRLQLFDNAAPDLGERRQAFADELAAQVARLDELRQMARAAGQSGTADRATATTGSVGMADIEWLVEQVDRAPEGPQIAAFFDFDGTLINGYSALAFFKYRLRKGDISAKEFIGSIRESINVERRGKDVEDLMIVGVRAQARKDRRRGRLVGAQRLLTPSGHDDLSRGASPRRCSPSSRPHGSDRDVCDQAAGGGTADDLGIDYIICTEMEQLDGIYTGKLGSEIRWGDGKARGVRDFAKENGIDLKECFAYGNGGEDVHFLGSVGHPVALNPDEDLEPVALDKRWAVAKLNPPQQTGLFDVARSVAAVGVFGGTVVASGAFGLAQPQPLVGREPGLGGRLRPDAGDGWCPIAGGRRGERIRGSTRRLHVQPSEPARRLRPRLPAAQGLQRGREEGTGKGPVLRPRRLPHPGRLHRPGGQRQGSLGARTGRRGAALRHLHRDCARGHALPHPSVAAVQEGSLPPRHAGGGPDGSVVMRNCGQIMAAHSMVVHPGIVDVAVLPPVPTDDWTKENLNEQVAKVRQMYLDTLADWPGGS